MDFITRFKDWVRDQGKGKIIVTLPDGTATDMDIEVLSQIIHELWLY
jgi:hypothetical protein